MSPNTISLPTGPGSIEGLGESFQPMLNTGTARYAMKIAMPPGVAGHGPELTLQYDSGLGDGPAGIGWTFGPGGVRRQTDLGIPRYVDGPNGIDDDHDGEFDEPDETDHFIGIEDEELVQLADGTFRARIEGTFVRYRRIGDGWEAHLKDGTRLEFGITPQARVADETGAKVYQWLLEKSTDTNGNVIEYSYIEFPGSDNRKYLKEIRYGPGLDPWDSYYFAYFSYEDRPDWRKDYRSGFPIKTAKRLKQIEVGIQGIQPEQCTPGDWNIDTDADALIRRYVLSYNETETRYSFLSTITRFGSDGVNSLPPMSFSYSLFSPETSVSAADEIISSPDAPPIVMDSHLAELIDLNRDGLPDLLQTDLNGFGHRAYMNLGMTREGNNREIMWDDGHDVLSPDGLAQQLYLSDNEVHLADMDGDGLSDLVHTPYSQEVLYYRNEGTGSWSGRKRMSIQDTAPPAPFTRDDVRTADLDFDKRMDVVMSTEEGYRIWFNLAEGIYSSEVHTAGAIYRGQVIRFSQPGVYFADMNGDRLRDVVRIRPTSIIYAANMGHGIFADAVEIPIPDTALTDGSNGQVGRARLEDINGDGLDDVVVERAVGTDIWYWLNQGIDKLSDRHIITDMPTIFGPNTATRWADMNGNSTTDLVYADSEASSRLRIIDIGELAGGSAHPNLLTGIDNGLGVHTEITYKNSTEYEQEARDQERSWSSTIPFPVAVISRVRTTTGLDVDDIPGTDEYIKEFSYRDGFYEVWRKAFRGFAEVTVTQKADETAPTSVRTHSFFTGGPDGVDNDGDLQTDEVTDDRYHYREEDALKGMIRSVTVKSEEGRLFSEENNHWFVRNLSVTPNNIEVRFAYNDMAETIVYEGTDAPETIRTTFSYDDFGNVTEEKKHGTLSITGDESFTFTEYINDTTAWMIGFPKRVLITDEAGQKYAETLNYYDGPDFTGLSSGQVTRGHLSRQQGWLEGNAYINVVRSAFDEYGNITAALDGNGSLRSVAWDTVLHTYPVQETIEVGGGKPDLVISADYNVGLGVITQSTDFNNHQTYYAYDRFSRLTSIIKPGDSSQYPTQSFTYTMTAPDKGLIYSYDREGNLTLQTGIVSPSSVSTSMRETSGQPGTFDVVQYVDGMGRKLALVEEGETGFIVKEGVIFNRKGTARFSFLPYETTTATYGVPALAKPALEHMYDPADRTILTVNPPDKDGVITQAATEYLPLVKRVVDENSIPKTFYHDGLDRIVAVHEHNEGEIYNTVYNYDPLGNLLQITDAQDNVKTFEYDGLARKTAMNDPDRGRMEYSYDDAGNLVQTVDNKGQVIAYTYDRVNRMLSEDYLDDDGLTPDITYFYDDPSPDYPDAINLNGKLSWVEDLSGGEFFSYDNRGNTKLTVKRIKGDSSSTTDYRTAFSYDAMNRIVSMIYPDSEQVSYEYNSRILLETVPGFVEHIDYHSSGQTAMIAYANGVSTTYAYDPRQRLTSLNSVSTLQNNAVIQDLAYTMDGVSNLVSITDGRILEPDSPKNATQFFQYDDLNRLTRADGPGYGAINFEYDRIGNMLFKSSPTEPDPLHIDDPLINLGIMSFGGTSGTSGRGLKLPGNQPGPHAITATESGLVYDYDNNGNMINHAAGNTYSWDFRDRLVQVQKGDVNTEYTYDYNGQRVIKKVNDGGMEQTTFYISDAFEVRGSKAVMYVFAGAKRVARIETDAGGISTSEQTLAFQPGWNFFSLQVEPDNPAVDALLAGINNSYSHVWGFDSGKQQYAGYIPSEGVADLTELHAGKGYLIKVTVPVSIMVTGTPVKGNINLSAGWNLAPSLLTEQKPVTEALTSISGLYDAVWGYDTAAGRWNNFLPEEQEFLNNLDSLLPAAAYWIKMKESAVLPGQDSPRTVHYYHPDHLGSSNLVTDADASVIESTEFYPFGWPRHEEHFGFDSAYKYTGKELDKESGLMYYEARYLDPVIGRFASVDPLAAALPSPGLSASQTLNYYAYTQNNPVKYIDPDGRELIVHSKELFDVMQQLTTRKLKLSSIGQVTFGAGVSASEYGTELGNRLVRELIESERTVNLRSASEFQGPSWEKVSQVDPGVALKSIHGGFFAKPKQKLSPTVYFALTSPTEVLTTGGIQTDRPAVIGLAHELIHAYHYMTGTYEQDLLKEERSTIGLREKRFRQAQFTENRFRELLMQPLRTSHRKDKPEKATVLEALE